MRSEPPPYMHPLPSGAGEFYSTGATDPAARDVHLAMSLPADPESSRSGGGSVIEARRRMRRPRRNDSSINMGLGMPFLDAIDVMGRRSERAPRAHHHHVIAVHSACMYSLLVPKNHSL